MEFFLLKSILPLQPQSPTRVSGQTKEQNLIKNYSHKFKTYNNWKNLFALLNSSLGTKAKNNQDPIDVFRLHLFLIPSGARQGQCLNINMQAVIILINSFLKIVISFPKLINMYQHFRANSRHFICIKSFHLSRLKNHYF